MAPVVAALALALGHPGAAGAQTDAPTEQQVELRRQLEEHAFFRQVDYTIDASQNGFLFVLQRPSRTDATYNARMVRGLAPFVLELRKVFDAEYVRPLGLRRRPDYPAYVICILESKGAYQNYAQATGALGPQYARAHFDPVARLAVTYEDSFAPNIDIRDRRTSLLHELVHAMTFAHHGGEEPMPAPQWLNEGLAEYRSVSTNVASSLREPDVHPHHLRVFAAMIANSRYRSFLSPLRELVTIDGPGYRGVIEAAEKRAGVVAGDGSFQEVAMLAFYAQSSLLAYFLHHGDDGAYREAFGGYFAATLRGEKGLDTFQKAFDGIDLDRIESDFYAFIRAEMAKRNWKPAALDAIGRGAAAVAGRADAAQPAAAGIPGFDFGRLAWRDEDWELRLIHALQQARAGQLRAAGRALAALEAPPTEAEFVARLTAGYTALADVRTRFLALAKQDGGKLRFRLDGKRPFVRVIDFDDETFELRIGSKTRVLPRDALSPEILLDEGEDLGLLQELGPTATALLHHVRGDDPGEVDDLLGDDAAGLAWKADLRRIRELETREADLSWAPVAAMDPPADPAAAAALLQELQAVVRQSADAPALRARRGDLEDLARHLVHASFDPGDPGSFDLHGEVELLGDGRFRISYDFEDEAQLADFAETENLLPMLSGLPDPTTPRGFYMRIEKGALEAAGKAQRRFVVPIAAPLRISYSVSTDGFAIWNLGFCGAGERRCCLVDMFGGLGVWDLDAGIVGDASQQENEIMIGQSYAHRVVHDGSSIEVSVDGRSTGRAERIGNLTGGDVFLFMHGNGPVRVDDLVIEGSIDPVAARRVLEERADATARGLFPN